MADMQDKTKEGGNETDSEKTRPPAYEYPNYGAPKVVPVYGYDQPGDITVSAINPQIGGNETHSEKPSGHSNEYRNNGASQAAPTYGYHQAGDDIMSYINSQVIDTQPRSILAAPFEDPDLKQLELTNENFMYFSIFVLFCCNLLFGGIGLFLGSSAKDALNRGEKEHGRSLSRAGCAVSCVGIPVSIIVLVLIFKFVYKL